MTSDENVPGFAGGILLLTLQSRSRAARPGRSQPPGLPPFSSTPVAFYCGTGWRASETFFYAYLMDWPNVSVYDGGWFEWSRQNGAGE